MGGLVRVIAVSPRGIQAEDSLLCERVKLGSYYLGAADQTMAEALGASGSVEIECRLPEGAERRPNCPVRRIRGAVLESPTRCAFDRRIRVLSQHDDADVIGLKTLERSADMRFRRRSGKRNIPAARPSGGTFRNLECLWDKMKNGLFAVIEERRPARLLGQVRPPAGEALLHVRAQRHHRVSPLPSAVN